MDSTYVDGVGFFKPDHTIEGWWDITGGEWDWSL